MVRACAQSTCVPIVRGLVWCVECVGVVCAAGFPSGSPSCLLRSASQEILFYKVIDYITPAKREDIKICP